MKLALLGGLGLGALAWRLEQGPLPVPWLAEQAEAALNAGGGRTRIQIGEAALAWSGWHEGHRSPVDLTLRQVRAVDGDGQVRAELPDAAVSVSLPWLFRGVVAPRSLELRGLSLRATRDATGRLTLDLGSLTEAPAAPPRPPGAPAAGAAVLETLAELMLPPSDNTPLAALRLLRVTEARLEVVDAQLGRAWAAEIASFALTRREGGGLDLSGLGAVALGPERVALRISGSLDGATGQGSVTLGLPMVQPAALARAAPVLAPLAALDAPASLAIDVRLDGLQVPSMGLARLRAGAGALDLGRSGKVRLSSLEADLTLDERTLRVERAVLRPVPPAESGAAPPPLIRARAEARETEGRWQAEATLAIDRVAVGELAHYWPEGLAPNARHWVTENITEGIARDGEWRVAAAWDMDSGAAQVTSLEGTLEAEELTVHWLRPVPPATDARGRVRFALGRIDIEIQRGRQGGSAVEVRDGHIRFGLASEPETAEMEFGLAGPVADVWTLLRHPRLGLFRTRPPPISEITGTLREGRLNVAFPLLHDIPVEVLQVTATGRGTDIRIPRLVLGKDLERGSFEFTADMNGLRTSGTATVLGIPLRIQQEADFRPGAANQVVAREVVTGRADARQIAGFGLDPRPFVEGPVGLDIRTETRRNGQGRVALRADLRESRLSVDALAWTKPPGTAGSGEATFVLQNGQLTAIEGIRVEAPDALVRARGTQVTRSIPQRVEIQQASLGRNRLAGELFPPVRPGAGWNIALRGQVLDLAPVLARPAGPPEGRAADEPPGPSVSIEGRFDRVLLAGERALTGMTATATVDGAGVVQAAQVRARVADGGDVELGIAAEGARRRLRISSDDGGALLRAFGVLRTVQGGRLRVDAAYPHGRPGAPLSGTAELEEFVVRDAPALGKLLQAMSVYGLFEALSGQGLNFASLTAPFTLTREALVLNDARAFSASLGLTAKGRIDRQREAIDMEGTIVPAYVFNSLLGRIPGLGRLFSPEQGGGLFAATYRMRGPLADPSVTVNPLAALTPGFLRGIFGLGQAGVEAPPAQGGR